MSICKIISNTLKLRDENGQNIWRHQLNGLISRLINYQAITLIITTYHATYDIIWCVLSKHIPSFP